MIPGWNTESCLQTLPNILLLRGFILLGLTPTAASTAMPPKYRAPYAKCQNMLLVLVV